MTVFWPWSHDGGDDPSQIQSELEAGGDEGPLLIVPCRLTRGGPRPYVTTHIYRDVHSYLAQLAVGEEHCEGERWIGLVQGTFRTNEASGLFALSHFKELIDYQSRLSRLKGPGERKVVQRSFELMGPFPSQRPLTIINEGEAFADVALQFPMLRQEMVIV